MHPRQQRFEAVLGALGHKDRGSFSRAVPLQFQNDPLNPIGSVANGGRYNPKGTFEALYLGDNADTVARETRMIIKDAAGNTVYVAHSPKIIMTINYELQRVTTLDDATIRKKLGITRKVLLEEWRDIVDAGSVPITHVLGAAAITVGIEGLYVPSAPNRPQTNLVIFPANLRIGSFVEIHHPNGFTPGVRTRIDGHL